MRSTYRLQKVLEEDPFCGHLFVFRGRGGDLVKIIWWDGQGACLFAKRLERGRFVWPAAKDGKVHLSQAQLAMLLEGIDWRITKQTWRPLTTGGSDFWDSPARRSRVDSYLCRMWLIFPMMSKR